MLVAVSFAATPAAHASDDGPAVPVIVEASSVAAATAAVDGVGGTVDLALPAVGGVAAHVRPGPLAALYADPALRVMDDATLHPTGGSFGSSGDRAPAEAKHDDPKHDDLKHDDLKHDDSHHDGSGPGATRPGVDPQLAALDLPGDWSAAAGRGAAVALIDTGVSASPDLQGNRLVRGPDLSGEGDGVDHYGHGTFMAGLIAGDGTASAHTGTPHFGVAPAATVVSVKVAGSDGSTTVSRVIAGIGWVIANRDAYGIGVLNLSFGVDAPMPYRFNPLSAAVEAAWASGITVVVSAGNDGDGHVTSPGSDPYVVTVGAIDNAGTPQTGDDVVPAWSGRERFRHYSKPEVAASGVSVVSLRAPGSTVDVNHPEGRVGDVYFRGSGTSMSTALVSGVAALLLAHHPAATPDDLKGALVDGGTDVRRGAPEVDANRADHADARPDWWQHYRVAFDGLDRDLDDGMPWTASRWTATRWTATRWTATRWTATRWTEAEWTASRWSSTSWDASRWTSTRWTSTRWTAEAWPSQGWG
ncbi:MAG: serine protease AprX [Actinomycetota bacterium]|nr:serine protease AprX [Actinomycetota bacterium]